MITLNELLSLKGRPELATVRLSDTLASAVERMVANDFHQLPVVDDFKRPIGMVSTISIAEAQRSTQKSPAELRVTEALEFTEQFKLDDDLFVALNALKERSAILIVDEACQLKGILTSYDALEYFRWDIEDQHLVKSVEMLLAECFDLASEGEQPDPTPEAQRTFNFYMNKFLSSSYWPKWKDIIGIPDSEMRMLLDRVRRVRNAFAHHKERSGRERELVRMIDTLLNRNMPAIRSRFEPPRTSGAPSRSESADAPIERQQGYGAILAELQRVPLETQTIKRTFAELEAVMQHPLPQTARTQEYWWNGTIEGNVPARSFYDLGWLAQVDLSAQSVTFRRLREREREYTRFFSELLKQLPDSVRNRTKPSGRSYHRICRITRSQNTGDLNVAFSLDKRFRIEFYINAPDRDRNKALFDALLTRREPIENELGERLDWDRIDDAQVSRIAWYRDTFITDGPQALSELRTWAVPQIVKFRQVLERELTTLSEHSHATAPIDEVPGK